MRKLFLIPARGGSKGLLRKNILPLAGRPMIYYTIDAALGAFEEGDELCVSTDDFEIIEKVQEYGIDVPFVRPVELASDTASFDDVICHALDWYKLRGLVFDLIVVLQPTSPLRNSKHVREALSLYSKGVDMVVSVKETDSNPYYVLFEEDDEGWLQKSKKGNFLRRQDCPRVYELNGSIYVINIKKLQNIGYKHLKRIKKMVMPKIDSIDIDDYIDLAYAETIIRENA